MPTFRVFVVAVACVSLAVAAGPEAYAALGVEESATGLDVQLAYMNTCAKYSAGASAGTSDRRSFVSASQAFEQLADSEMKSEVLNAVKYDELIFKAEDDQALQHFMEFQTGGSAHLRIMFFLENKGEPRHWGIWAVASQLNGNVRVGQIWQQDARGSDGVQGPFMASLRVRQFPSAVIYDPISRAMKISFGVDGVIQEAQKFLNGQFSETDRLLRVQELDTESFRHRCGETEEEIKTNCDSTLILATSADYEARREELMETLRTVLDACRLLHNLAEVGKSFACFWLRFGNAGSDWHTLFTKSGMSYHSDFALAHASWHPRSFSVAEAETVKGAPYNIQTWFRGEVFSTPAALEEALPALPAPMSKDAGPSEDFFTMGLRNVRQLMAKYEIEPDFGKIKAKAEVEFNKLDFEEKIMVVGGILCAVMLTLFVLKTCCCRKRGGPLSEEAMLGKLLPLAKVVLQKQEGEKLGMGITPVGGVFLVTSVKGGDLIDRWNQDQPQPACRVKDQDQIVAVTAQGIRNIDTNTMGGALKAIGEVTLDVAMERPGDAMSAQRIHTCILLEGMALKDVAEFRAPQLSWAGKNDKDGLEFASLSPKLSEWSAKRKEEGSCCLQALQAGDRIIAVNSSTIVHSNLDKPGPTLLVARYGPPGSFSSQSVQVKIEKQEGDKLGMHIQSLPGSTCIQVLDVLESGAVHRVNQSLGHGQGVVRGDRIVDVNGKKVFGEMQQELASMTVVITLERWVDSANGGSFSPPVFSPPAAKVDDTASAPAKAAAAAKPPAQPNGSATGGGSGMRGALPFLFFGGLAALVALLLPQSGDKPVGSQAKLSDIMLGEKPHSNQYVQLALGFLGIGVLCCLYFLWYEFSGLWDPTSRRTFPQVVVAAVASVFLGYGNFFLLTWAGVYA